MTIYFPNSDKALEKYKGEGHRCTFELADPNDRTKIKPCGGEAIAYASHRSNGLCEEHAVYAHAVTGGEKARYL